jgi:anti-sigma factor RsiW
MMSPCREWNDRLLDFALGDLEPRDAAAVEAHLAGCGACAAAVSEFQRRAAEINSAVHQIVQGAELRPGFFARVLARLEARPAPAWPRWRLAVLGAGLATALVLGAILGPFLARRWPSLRQPAPAPVAALSTWQSPTEGLLRSSGEELLEGAPRLGEFYFRLPSVRNDRGEDKGGNKDES